jgi:hypothetical protein
MKKTLLITSLVFWAGLMVTACDDMLEDEREIYDKYHEMVSMVGDATSGGWDTGAATPLLKVNAATFTWTGTLKRGDIKFAYDNPQYDTGKWYLAEKEDQPIVNSKVYSMFYSPAGSSGQDYKWKIDKPGVYTINVYLDTKTVQFSTGYLFDHIWVIGSATGTGLALQNDYMVELNKSTLEDEYGIYKRDIPLKAGTLKFICGEEKGLLSFGYSPQFLATEADMVPAGDWQDIIYHAGGFSLASAEDCSFKITAEGVYAIKLNPYNRKISIVQKP